MQHLIDLPHWLTTYGPWVFGAVVVVAIGLYVFCNTMNNSLSGDETSR
jgi:uncharacterized membrane protein YgaE (UPF0421/DUF939 family)